MVQQKRLLSPLPLNWGTEPPPPRPIKQTAAPCRVTSSAAILQHQHEISSYAFIPAITTTNIPVPLRLTTCMDYPVQLTSSFLFAFYKASSLPRVTNTSFTAPLPFRDNYFFVDSVPTFGKTVYFKRDFKKPRKSLGSNFRNSCGDGPFGPGRLQTLQIKNLLQGKAACMHYYKDVG